ncbi:MAG: RNA polymerase sigma factor [Faecalibacterium sp.]
MDDIKIIALYWARSEQAIAQTAQKYQRYCHSIAFHILHSEQDAEECVNETYLAAWNSMPPQRPNALCAFLGRITRNLSLNRYEAAHAAKRGGGQTALVLEELKECLSGGNAVDEAMDEAFVLAVLNRFLAAQPKRKRDIFVKRYWYLLSSKEIAQAVGYDEAGVNNILSRMRAALKQELAKEGVQV